MKNFTASFSIKGKSEDLQKSVPFMQQNWHKGFICSVAKKESSYNKDFSPKSFFPKNAWTFHPNSFSTFYKRNLSKLHRKVKLTLIFCKLWLPCQSLVFEIFLHNWQFTKVSAKFAQWKNLSRFWHSTFWYLQTGKIIRLIREIGISLFHFIIKLIMITIFSPILIFQTMPIWKCASFISSSFSWKEESEER